MQQEQAISYFIDIDKDGGLLSLFNMARKIKICQELISMFQEAIGIFTIKPTVEKIKRDFSICVESCKYSKINFFFQVINFSLTLYLLRFIFPPLLNDLIGYSLSFFILCLVNLCVYPMIFFQTKKATILFFVILAILTINIKNCVRVSK